jgi:hypothetical protein
MASDPASLPSPAPVAPTHPCVRCGRPTAIDRGLCEECNPLGLRDASSSQVHGTVFLGVLLAVVVLAVLGRLALSGVGPFSAEIASVSAAADGLTVTFEVTNTGTSAGQTTCRVSDASPRSRGATAIVQSPRIEPGETRSFTRELTEFGSEARELAVECHAP